VAWAECHGGSEGRERRARRSSSDRRRTQYLGARAAFYVSVRGARAANCRSPQAGLSARSASARRDGSRRCSNGSTGSKRHSSSSEPSTSRPTTVTRTSSAKSSLLRRLNRHSSELDELDVEGSSRSPSGCCLELPICGCRPHSTSDSGSNNCSFPTESRSTETALFEPP
jgi:hypothetical protein